MKKTILVLLLALVLVLGMSAAALASYEDPVLYVDGSDNLYEDPDDAPKGVTFDPDKNILTLSGAKIDELKGSGYTYGGIYWVDRDTQNEEYTIILEGDNSIEGDPDINSSTKYGIFGNFHTTSTLSIEGPGRLSIEDNDLSTGIHIMGLDELTISELEELKIDVSRAYSYGICVLGYPSTGNGPEVTIEETLLDIEADFIGIYSTGDLNLWNCWGKIIGDSGDEEGSGINCASDLDIDGCDFHTLAGEGYRIEGRAFGIYSGGSITLSDSNLIAKATNPEGMAIFCSDPGGDEDDPKIKLGDNITLRHNSKIVPVWDWYRIEVSQEPENEPDPEPQQDEQVLEPDSAIEGAYIEGGVATLNEAAFGAGRVVYDFETYLRGWSLSNEVDEIVFPKPVILGEEEWEQGPAEGTQAEAELRRQDQIMQATGMLLMGVGRNFPFIDVPENHWAYRFIYEAFKKDMINGKTPVMFFPDDPLTYAEAIKLAATARQVVMDGAVSFEPAQPGQPWYAPYVAYAELHQIIKPGEFSDRYNKAIPRYEFGYIFAHTLGESGYQAIKAVDSIPDVPSSHKYFEDILKLYKAKIVTGDAEGKYNGGSNIKRSEAATILIKLIDPEER